MLLLQNVFADPSLGKPIFVADNPETGQWLLSPGGPDTAFGGSERNRAIGIEVLDNVEGTRSLYGSVSAFVNISLVLPGSFESNWFDIKRYSKTILWILDEEATVKGFTEFNEQCQITPDDYKVAAKEIQATEVVLMEEYTPELIFYDVENNLTYARRGFLFSLK